jgi:hypothetical protein
LYFRCTSKLYQSILVGGRVRYRTSFLPIKNRSGSGGMDQRALSLKTLSYQ